MTNSLQDLDDSQIAIRIAFRAAVVATILYTLLFIVDGVFPKIGQIDYLEPILKVLFVVIALKSTTAYLVHAKKLPNNQSVPFLSTVFFYGIMLLLVYLAQIGYLVVQTVLWNPSSFLSKLEFLLGVRGLSTSAILSGFVAGHLPFLAYYFTLAHEMKKV